MRSDPLRASWDPPHPNSLTALLRHGSRSCSCWIHPVWTNVCFLFRNRLKIKTLDEHWEDLCSVLLRTQTYELGLSGSVLSKGGHMDPLCQAATPAVKCRIWCEAQTRHLRCVAMSGSLSTYWSLNVFAGNKGYGRCRNQVPKSTGGEWLRILWRDYKVGSFTQGLKDE